MTTKTKSDAVATQAYVTATAATAAATAVAAYVGAPTSADTAINDTSDVAIVSHNVAGVVAGDQIAVDAWFVVLNNSSATRVYTFTLDFDGEFDIEFSTGACAASSTLMHPFHISAVCDIRSTSLAYAMIQCVGQLAAGIAAGGDTTMDAASLSGMSWGTSTSNLTGTLTVTLKARSADNAATQTLRLHSFSVRKVTPT